MLLVIKKERLARSFRIFTLVKYALFIALIVLSMTGKAQDFKYIQAVYNSGNAKGAWMNLVENEKELYKKDPAQTAYLFAKLGCVLYNENPAINSYYRLKAFKYVKVLFEEGDDKYLCGGKQILISLLESVHRDMELVLMDYASSINRGGQYLDDFCNDILPYVPMLAESGYIEDPSLIYNYGVIFNNEAMMLLEKSDLITDDERKYEMEEKAAVLYVAATRLMSASCSLADNYCTMDGATLVLSEGSKSSAK